MNNVTFSSTAFVQNADFFEVCHYLLQKKTEWCTIVIEGFQLPQIAVGVNFSLKLVQIYTKMGFNVKIDTL